MRVETITLNKAEIDPIFFQLLSNIKGLKTLTMDIISDEGDNVLHIGATWYWWTLDKTEKIMRIFDLVEKYVQCHIP